MPRIRYVAILSEAPRALASFYCATLGMRELGESATGDLVVTDGFVKLAIFRLRGDLGEARMEPGLHHLGIAVDRFEPIKARFRRHDPRGVMVPEPPGLPYGELRFYDPETIPVSLSERSFGMEPGGQASPRLGHVGFDVLDPDAMADFYINVFGFAIGRATGEGERPDRTVDDGSINLTFHFAFEARRGPDPRYGLHHLGFLVEDARKLAESLPGTGLSPAPPEAGTVYAARDPDGNRLRLMEASRPGAALEGWRRSA